MFVDFVEHGCGISCCICTWRKRRTCASAFVIGKSATVDFRSDCWVPRGLSVDVLANAAEISQFVKDELCLSLDKRGFERRRRGVQLKTSRWWPYVQVCTKRAGIIFRFRTQDFEKGQKGEFMSSLDIHTCHQITVLVCLPLWVISFCLTTPFFTEMNCLLWNCHLVWKEGRNLVVQRAQASCTLAAKERFIVSGLNLRCKPWSVSFIFHCCFG